MRVLPLSLLFAPPTLAYVQQLPCVQEALLQVCPQVASVGSFPVPSIRPLRLAPDLPRQLAPPLFLAAITTVPISEPPPHAHHRPANAQT